MRTRSTRYVPGGQPVHKNTESAYEPKWIPPRQKMINWGGPDYTHTHFLADRIRRKALARLARKKAINA